MCDMQMKRGRSITQAAEAATEEGTAEGAAGIQVQAKRRRAVEAASQNNLTMMMNSRNQGLGLGLPYWEEVEKSVEFVLV